MAKASKSSLKITRDQFRTEAKPIPITLNGKELLAPVKEFSTGSLGWYVNEKILVDIGGELVTVQVGINMTIVGSKELPQDDKPAAATPAPPPPEPDGGSVPGQADF